MLQVFEDLLGFEGNEFYKETWPQLTGRTFGETMFAFADAVPIGIKSMASGKVVLNPPDDYQIRDGDKVLVIAEDNDTYTYQEPFQVSREFALPKVSVLVVLDRGKALTVARRRKPTAAQGTSWLCVSDLCKVTVR